MLRARGPRILPLLRDALRSNDGEIRTRIQSIIAELEVVAALEPKQVNLISEQQSVSDCAKKIESQTGYRFEIDEKTSRILHTPRNTKAKFWEAVDEMAKSAGAVTEVNYRKRLVYLDPGTRTPIRHNVGPFQLLMTNLREYKERDFNQPSAANVPGKQDDYISLKITVDSEPRFLVLRVDEPIIESAIDENEKPFGRAASAEDKRRIAEDEKETRSPFATKLQVATIYLHRSNAESKKIKDLRGWIPVQMVIDRQRFVVTKSFEKAHGTKFDIDGQTFEIGKPANFKNGASVYISGPRQSEEIERRWYDRVQLEDDNGNLYTPDFDLPAMRVLNIPVWLNYYIAKGAKTGPATKLIFEKWLVADYRIRFEFKDVPLR